MLSRRCILSCSCALALSASTALGEGEGLLSTPKLRPVPSPIAETTGGNAAPQSNFAPRPAPAPRYQPAPASDPMVTNQTRQALSFYGGHSARATLSQLPRRTPIQAAPPRPMQTQLKPFTAVQPDPTLSPFLNLDRAETADDFPNYFAFVRPQMQQMDTNRGQQRELNRLQRQLNSVSSTVVSPQQGQGLPGTGTRSRFMDTAQFYGGWRR